MSRLQTQSSVSQLPFVRAELALHVEAACRDPGPNLAEPRHRDGRLVEQEIWAEYYRPLTAFARRSLGRTLAAKLDPEEIVQSVFSIFFQHLRDGRFQLRDDEHTRHLLVHLTHRSCSHCWKYYHAACRDIRREVPLTEPSPDLENPNECPAHDSRPDDEILLNEALDRVLGELTCKWQQIAVRLSVRGWDTREIGLQLHRTRRAVQQVLLRVRQHLTQMDGEGQ